MLGIGVSKKRLDDLDKAVIQYALNLPENVKKKSVDLGSGSGRISFILSLLGFESFVFDLQDYKNHFISLQKEFDIKIYFEQKNILEIDFDLFKDAQIIIMQKMIHYLPYKNARNLLLKIKENLPINAKVFISFSGINTPLAYDYVCKKEVIENRFCMPSKQISEKFKINTNICLYSKKEAEQLLKNTGFKIEKIWESRFKNIKAIATKI